LVFCRKAKRNVTAELFGWFGEWMNSVSEIAETTMSVKQFAPLEWRDVYYALESGLRNCGGKGCSGSLIPV
jgi:hypothetical protein